MPIFHAYCQNSIEHAKLANKVSISMSKTLKASLRARCKFDGYSGRGNYYYFINPIRVISFVVLDSGSTENRYSGEYRRDYVYDDEEYNKDIFIDTSLGVGFMGVGLEIAVYKKSFFMNVFSEQSRYKLDGVYVNSVQGVVVNGVNITAVMLKAGLKTGDIIRVDNRDCFLIKNSDSGSEHCSCIAIAID